MIRTTPPGCFYDASKRLLTACGLGLLLAATPAAAQQRAPERPIERSVTVRQLTLLVEDMDRALDFYTRLGLSRSSDRTIAEGDQDAVFSAADLPLASDPKSARVVILKGSGDQSGLIGLVAYDRPRLSSARGSLGGLGTGDVIITVEVPDIQENLSAPGPDRDPLQRIPYKFTLTNADGTHQAVMRMLAFDPDGHLAEIVQPDTGHGFLR